MRASIFEISAAAHLKIQRLNLESNIDEWIDTNKLLSAVGGVPGTDTSKQAKVNYNLAVPRQQGFGSLKWTSEICINGSM